MLSAIVGEKTLEFVIWNLNSFLGRSLLGGGTTGNIAYYHTSLFIENELLDYKASKGVIKFLIEADISRGKMTSVLIQTKQQQGSMT